MMMMIMIRKNDATENITTWYMAQPQENIIGNLNDEQSRLDIKRHRFAV